MSVFAAIDCGTNSFRLVTGRKDPDTGYRFLSELKEPVRIGADLFTGEVITEKAIERGIAALNLFQKEIQREPVSRVRCVGTSAFREAKNSAEVIERFRKETGLQLEIIRGTEEARIISLGILKTLRKDGSRFLLVDIGGGSTELTIVENGEGHYIESAQVGAVRLTNLFLKNDPPSEKEQKLLANFIDDKLRRPLRRILESGFDEVVGSAGTMTTLAKMSREGAKLDRSNLYTVKTVFVRQQLERILEMKTSERAKLPGMSKQRAEIAIAGFSIASYILSGLGVKQFKVSGRGLVDGLMIDMIEDAENHPLYSQYLTRQHRADFNDLAARYRLDKIHAERVQGFALDLFDQMKDLHHLGERERNWLSAAAFFHDIGMLIAMNSHHKHSEYIIRNMDISGYSQTDLDMVARIARFHRKAEPTPKRPEVAVLSSADQQKLMWLAAILRTADGLDRSHASHVKSVRAIITKDLITIELATPFDVDLDIWAAENKGEMLGKLADRKVKYRVMDSGPGGE
ncbi:MAG: Ppx/GppA family phosphatase [Deltaproteobacteria bacterium]|nr:Ppx/GppA family phosphatase [Deltaproteobacteria bacterium]